MADREPAFSERNLGFSLFLTWEGDVDVAELEFPAGGGAEIWQANGSWSRSVRFVGSWPKQSRTPVLPLNDFLTCIQQSVVMIRRREAFAVEPSFLLSADLLGDERNLVEVRLASERIAHLWASPEGVLLIRLSLASGQEETDEMPVMQLTRALWDASVWLDTVSGFRDLEQLADRLEGE